jgi:hypothetical protein
MIITTTLNFGTGAYAGSQSAIPKAMTLTNPNPWHRTCQRHCDFHEAARISTNPSLVRCRHHVRRRIPGSRCPRSSLGGVRSGPGEWRSCSQNGQNGQTQGFGQSSTDVRRRVMIDAIAGAQRRGSGNGGACSN